MLEQLSHIWSLSTAHFSRLFQLTTGTSPIKYLLTLRLNEAVYLLKNSDRSIAQIATERGMGSHLLQDNMWAGISQSCKCCKCERRGSLFSHI